jgi:broad specificity phosphatase PhoE
MYVSPQERAYETGRFVAKRLGINQMIVSPAFRERDFGLYAGIPIKDVRAACDRRNEALARAQMSRDAAKRETYGAFVPDEMIGEMNESGDVTAHWFNQTPKFPGEDAGELWPEGQRRIVNAVVGAMADNPGCNLAIATHGDVARMLVAAFNGLHWRELLEHGNSYLDTIRNGSVVTLDVNTALRKLLANARTKQQGHVERLGEHGEEGNERKRG